MKFQLNNNELKHEVNLLQGIAERKSGIGALSSLLIETIPNGIRLIGTDLDTTIQVEIEATVKEEGSVCVPAKRLCDIVRSLDDGIVKVTKDANHWVRLTCNTSKFRMQGMSKDHFPTMPEITANEIVLGGDSIKNLIKHTCFAITQEESRFTLSGAKLKVKEGKSTMVATDGHRIAIMEDSLDDIESELDILIPKKALQEVSKFVENEVAIKDTLNHIKFQSGDRCLITRKLSSNFPNYELAIPKDNNIKVSFNAEDMVKALKRVAIMADERSRAVRIEVKEKKLLLKADANGEGEEEVQCKSKNLPETDLIIHLNWQYLMEFLITCEKPHFKIKDSLSAIEVIEGNAKYILMPLRTS